MTRDIPADDPVFVWRLVSRRAPSSRRPRLPEMSQPRGSWRLLSEAISEVGCRVKAVAGDNAALCRDLHRQS
jgi:hypothetical protein